MTRMAGPDCAVMFNLINTHTHTHTGLWLTLCVIVVSSDAKMTMDTPGTLTCTK